MKIDAFLKDIFQKKAQNLVKTEEKEKEHLQNETSNNRDSDINHTKMEKSLLEELTKLKDENVYFKKEISQQHDKMQRMKQDMAEMLDKYIPRLIAIMYKDGFFDGVKYRENAEKPNNDEVNEVMNMRLDGKKDFTDKFIATMKRSFIKEQK